MCRPCPTGGERRCAGWSALEPRLIAFLAIAYKLENGQGLVAVDRRVLAGFRQFLKEQGVAEEALFTEAGFRLVITDVFHLLASCRLAMMRMGAIKYLWKKIGGRNFEMEELAAAVGREAGELATLPAVDFFLQWVGEGRTVYELCCTSRSAPRELELPGSDALWLKKPEDSESAEDEKQAAP